jgi:hypothetical protein
MQAAMNRSILLFVIALSGALWLTGCDWIPQTGNNGPRPNEVPQDLLPAIQDPGTWAFAESAELTCRDGSSTGIGVRLQPDDRPGRRGGDDVSDNLVIFMEGGGACFDFFTCSQNRANFSRDDFFGEDFIGRYSGIFDAEHPDNPVADWNFVYVPYCTGDEHAGSNVDGDVPDFTLPNGGVLQSPKDQQFVGHDNMGRVVEYIRRYLGKTYDNILLTGSSAGGVGTLANYQQVVDGFPASKVTALDDSGPVFYDDNILPAALQQLWRSTWDISEVLPPPGEDGVDPSDDIERIYQTMADDVKRDASLGLISYEQDATIRFFYSFGVALNDPVCAAQLYGGLSMRPPRRVACIEPEEYEDALYALRGELPDAWTTFYAVESEEPDPVLGGLAPSELHTFLRVERFYEASAEGQSLADWTRDLIDGRAVNRGSR